MTDASAAPHPVLTRNTVAEHLLAAARKTGRGFLAEPAAKAIIAAYGIAIPRHRVLTRSEEVDSALRALTPPYALKVISRTINHKSETGGVRLHLASAAEVRAAMEDMAASPKLGGHVLEGFLLEEMAAKGVELVIGGMIDDCFGPAVMVGLGGILVEILEDVSFRLCPITPRDAAEMLDELRGRPILSGARGAAAPDIAAIIEALLCVGGEDGFLCQMSEEIQSLDINPLIASPSGVTAVDARIILRTPV